MKASALVCILAVLCCSSAALGRSLLASCPHATSSLWNCVPVGGASTGLIVCLNLCPVSTDPCAPCSNPAQTCSSVDANRTSQPPRDFTATLNEYQYGDVCFSAAPPAGAVGKENANPGLPSVTNPDTGGPTPSYTGKAAPPPRGR